jgi:polysaccharide export outer membrane protein
MVKGGMVKLRLLIIIGILLSAFEAGASDYIIGGGDTLNISVWGSPELSLTITVRPDGKISLPALGEVKAAGYTPLQLTQRLERELSKIVKKPIVTVIVTNMTNYRIYVFGRGAPAGVYTLSRETTLLKFLSRLGKLDNADLESSYLIRNRKKIKTDFYALFERGDFSQDIILEPDDMLFIPDNFEKRISIVGAVNKPVTVPYRDGLTILDVILEAGGFTQFAKESSVKILRKSGNNRIEVIKVNAKVLIRKGDIKENILMKPGDFVSVMETVF